LHNWQLFIIGALIKAVEIKKPCGAATLARLFICQMTQDEEEEFKKLMDSLTIGSIGPAIAAVAAVNPTIGAIFGAVATIGLLAARVIIPNMKKRRAARKKKESE